MLLRSIALARRWLGYVVGGTSIKEVAALEGCTIRHVENTLPLAFLAPDIIGALIDARLPRGITSRSIAEPALEWSRQCGVGSASPARSPDPFVSQSA